MIKKDYLPFSMNRSRAVKYILLLCLVCLSAFLFADVNRQTGDTLIIIPNNTAPYRMIINSIRHELALKNQRVKLQVLNISSRASSRKMLEGNRLVITLGAKSLDYYLNSGAKTPFISSFITEGAFAALISKKQIGGLVARKYVGGISLEQPLKRIVSLVRIIQKKIKSIGVVLGPNTLRKQSSLRQQIHRQIGGKLNVANISSKDHPVNKLRKIFQKSQMVIVIPDKASFNRTLARWVVTLSYKHKVPVISYSKKYADAGALISLYSDPTQIGRQTAKILMSNLHVPTIKALKLSPPRYFQIAINKSVSKAFGLKLPSEDVLLRQLYKTE